ncbi:unnamed protein product [Camellia sinensis]
MFPTYFLKVLSCFYFFLFFFLGWIEGQSSGNIDSISKEMWATMVDRVGHQEALVDQEGHQEVQKDLEGQWEDQKE